MATGSTPLPTYAALKALFLAPGSTLDLSSVVTFNLDEYIGLPLGHPESYRSFMFQNLFVPALLHSELNPRGIREENIHIPGHPLEQSDLDSAKSDFSDKARSYEALLDAQGPIDLQLLGIGLNGHIGFNEPGAPLEGLTHVEELTESTRQANARFFDDDIAQVPKRAITMGIQSILKSKRVVLIATGKGKAEIIRNTVQSQVDVNIPATALHLHPHTTFWLDQEANSLLQK